MAGQAEEHKGGQWAGIHQWQALGMGGKTQHHDPAYPTGQAATECLYRALSSPLFMYQ